jgi:hypothetical protein
MDFLQDKYIGGNKWFFILQEIKTLQGCFQQLVYFGSLRVINLEGFLIF